MPWGIYGNRFYTQEVGTEWAQGNPAWWTLLRSFEIAPSLLWLVSWSSLWVLYSSDSPYATYLSISNFGFWLVPNIFMWVALCFMCLRSNSSSSLKSWFVLIWRFWNLFCFLFGQCFYVLCRTAIHLQLKLQSPTILDFLSQRCVSLFLTTNSSLVWFFLVSNAIYWVSSLYLVRYPMWVLWLGP